MPGGSGRAAEPAGRQPDRHRDRLPGPPLVPSPGQSLAPRRRQRSHAPRRHLADLPSEEWREEYYRVREDYNAGPPRGPLHAARFIWLNRAGFNGLYRENRKGEFNVPVGRYARLSLPAESHFREVQDRSDHRSGDSSGCPGKR